MPLVFLPQNWSETITCSYTVYGNPARIVQKFRTKRKYMRTFVRYLLFQIPELFLLALLLWLLLDRNIISQWTAQGFFILWIIKELAIYPWVRHSYEVNPQTGITKLIGAKGLAQEQLDPEGYVKINGELWKARTESTNQPIAPNTVIRVSAATGMTLIVETVDFHRDEKPNQSPSSKA